MPTKHEAAEAGLDLLIDAAASFEGDADGELTDEERELLWEIADAVEDEDGTPSAVLPIQNAQDRP